MIEDTLHRLLPLTVRLRQHNLYSVFPIRSFCRSCWSRAHDSHWSHALQVSRWSSQDFAIALADRRHNPPVSSHITSTMYGISKLAPQQSCMSTATQFQQCMRAFSRGAEKPEVSEPLQRRSISLYTIVSPILVLAKLTMI
jgi:hypothetical protein